MKFSKHVETCFVRANDDFDDKSTYIYCFLNKKKYWTKIPKNGHCVCEEKYFSSCDGFFREEKN